MSTVTTPNMGMVLPVPSSEPGPAWAAELLTALQNILDTHRHIPGEGRKIPAGSAIDFTSTVDFGNQNIVDLFNLFFSLSNSDPGTGQMTLFTLGNGDLGWYDNDSNKIQVTNAGKLNIPNANVGIKNADYTITNTDGFTFVAVDSTVALRNITLPSAAANPGRRLVIKDQKGQAATHVINVIRAGGDTIDGATSVVLNTNFSKCIVFSDGSNWLREA